jgi:hypothetical protein
MTALDARTDLFDLFGQEGTCTVCMETLRDGDRVRAVHGCDHLFHAACVEPWLLSRGTCPMCRAEVVSVHQAPAALQSTTEALQGLQSVIQNLESTEGGGVHPLLAEIQRLLAQTQGNLEARKRELAYVLGFGIQLRFQTAGAFNAARESLIANVHEFQFEGITPSPLVFTSRSALINSYRGYWPRELPAKRRIRELTDRLRAARPSSQFIQNFWRTD